MEKSLEKEKLEKAINVISALSEGVDYYSGASLDENNILNNPKYIRLFKYVEEVLKYKVKIGGNSKSSKDIFHITNEQVSSISPSDENLGVNSICKYINEHMDLTNMKALTGHMLNQALAKMGVIESVRVGDKMYWFATEKYKENYGIVTKEYVSPAGVKIVTLNYTKRGQQFILDNLVEMLKLLE